MLDPCDNAERLGVWIIDDIDLRLGGEREVAKLLAPGIDYLVRLGASWCGDHVAGANR